MNAIKRIKLIITALSLALPIAQPLAAIDLLNPATMQAITQPSSRQNASTSYRRPEQPAQSFNRPSVVSQASNQAFAPQPAWISEEMASACSLGMLVGSMTGTIPSELSTVLHPALTVAGYDRQRPEWPSKKELFIRSLIAGCVINKASHETLSLIKEYMPDVPYVKSCLFFATCMGLGMGYSSLYRKYCDPVVGKSYAFIASLFKK